MSSHQTVRLARGRHPSPSFGACVMELASMLADEPFTDRPDNASPVIAAFLRTYNDGIDDERRQDLFALASLSGRPRVARSSGSAPAAASSSLAASTTACRPAGRQSGSRRLRRVSAPGAIGVLQRQRGAALGPGRSQGLAASAVSVNADQRQCSMRTSVNAGRCDVLARPRVRRHS